MSMTSRRTSLAFAGIALLLTAPPSWAALGVLPVGYAATRFAVLSGSAESIVVDPEGNLDCTQGAAGVTRVTRNGISSPWSAAGIDDISLAPAGDAYGAGRALCHCIEHIDGDGSFQSLHQDALEWTYVGLAPDGTLYASVGAGTGQGLYTIDRTTGVPSPVVTGGPGPGGGGIYFDFAFGSDAELYTLGSLDGSLAGSRLFRLDGTTFTAVATPPHGATGITPGPGGSFCVTTNYDAGSGSAFGEVWMLDPTTGDATQLATAQPEFHYNQPQFAGIGYDPVVQRLYVIESNGQIWSIWNTTPARSTTWGAVKALYRGERSPSSPQR